MTCVEGLVERREPMGRERKRVQRWEGLGKQREQRAGRKGAVNRGEQLMVNSVKC